MEDLQEVLELAKFHDIESKVQKKED